MVQLTINTEMGKSPTNSLLFTNNKHFTVPLVQLWYVVLLPQTYFRGYAGL